MGWQNLVCSWLRDYLYISLGGNRHGTARNYRNLMLTMLLGGLWHGANWTFIIWGGLHGAYLVLQRVLGVLHRRLPLPPLLAQPVAKALAALAVFSLTTLAWAVFPSASALPALTAIV